MGHFIIQGVLPSKRETCQASKIQQMRTLVEKIILISVPISFNLTLFKEDKFLSTQRKHNLLFTETSD